MISKHHTLIFTPLLLLLAGCPGPGAVDGGSLRLAAFDGAVASDRQEPPICEMPIGLAAVVQPGDEVLDRLEEMQLGSPEPLLRKMMLDSNCFEVVDLDLIADGEVKDQLHYLLRPQVTVSEPEAMGTRGSKKLGELFGEDLTADGSISVRAVETVLSLSDARTGVLLAAATGMASGADVSGSLSGSQTLDLGAYGSTPEGQVIAAAFANAFGQLVAGLGEREIQSASR